VFPEWTEWGSNGERCFLVVPAEKLEVGRFIGQEEMLSGMAYRDSV
jgi:hypothetical protein